MIAENGNHMSTGFLGTRPLLPVLSASGQHDLATFLVAVTRVSVLGLRDRQWRDDDLGTLGQLHQRRRVWSAQRGDEFVLALRLRRGL